VRFGAHLSRADHVVERLRELLDGLNGRTHR
jgi:hypothetical protein